MRAEKIAELVPGDRVWWWFDDGWHGSQVVMPIVRVNPKTVTCTNRYGENIRIPHHQIDGLWTDPEDGAQ